MNNQLLKSNIINTISPGYISINIPPETNVLDISEYPNISTPEMKKMTSSLHEETNQDYKSNQDKNANLETSRCNEVNNRTKFRTIHENETGNTDDEINTDEHTYNTPEEDSMHANVAVFSVTSLNRKLTQTQNSPCNIQKSETRRWSITKPSNRRSNNINISDNSNQALSQDRMNAVTITMNPSKLIKDHLCEIQLRIIGHTRTAISYEKKDKIIGYPVTILSSFITSAIMMKIAGDATNNQNIIKYVSLSLSVMSFLFSVSRDYLNYAKKHQSHDLSAKLYTTLLRSVEVRLIKNHLGKEDKREIFKDIIDQMSIIEQYETPIPTGIDNKVRDANQYMLHNPS
jgi:hypothetical protein